MPVFLWSQSREYQFNRLDVRNGLSHNQVNSILKDDKGFMWVGTMSGLNRYDGHQFKIFRHTSDTTSINDNYIEQIVQGPDHKLWIFTRAGWALYNPVTEKFSSNPLSYLQSLHLPDASFSDIKRDRNGNFWFIYPGKGLYLYNTAKKTSSLYKAGNNGGLYSNNIASLAQNKKGDFWIAYTDGMLEKMDGKNFRISERFSLQTNTGTAAFNFRIFIDNQDDLWLYVLNNSDKGVFYYNAITHYLQSIKRENGPARLNNNVVNGITQDDKGLIWIATDHGGINIIDKKDWSVQYLTNHTEDEKSISHNSIYSIYKDESGIIWAGTFKRGLNYFHENFTRFPLYKHKPSVANSLPYDDINRFVEDEKGNLWIGTNGGGLIYFNRATGKFSRYLHDPANPNSLSNNVVVSLFIDHQQKLWIGTYFGGLNSYDGNKFTHYRHNEKDTTTIADDRVWEIFEDSQKRLWIGTLASGLDLFDRQRNVFIHHKPFQPGSIHSFYISSITEDRRGNVWFGTAYGVDVLKRNAREFTNYLHDDNNKNSLSNNNIMAVMEDSRGYMWIGTRDGLNILSADRKTFTSFTTANGLPDNTILTILEDNNKQIWISTPNGLSNISLNKDSKGALAIQTKNYDEKDGLQGREFNESAALKTNKGELVFAGPYGFNIFFPKAVEEKTTSSNIVLTGMQVFNKTVSIGDELNNHVVLTESITEASKIKLRYNQNVFSIEFSALDFANAEKIKYAYILEGFNSQWLVTDARSRKATFTNLDPGDYVFKVKIANADGSLSNKEASLKIVILPPFWRTIWAYILYLVLAGGILILGRYLTLRRAKMRFALERERQEAHRLHELDMLKIKFFTNISHEFRTPLSLILAPLDKIIKQTSENEIKKQLTLVQRNAKRLLNLVNLLLDFRRMEVQEFRLNLSEGDIVYFIKDLTYSFSDIAEKKNIQLNFVSSVSGFVTFFDKDKMEKVVFNLLSNAFRFTQDGGKITVQIDVQERTTKEENKLILRVTDTGIGIPKEDQKKIFERFFQHDAPAAIVSQGSGLGLAITKEFVKLFGGFISVESEPDKGTCFIVVMPVQKVTDGPLPHQYIKEEVRMIGNEEVVSKTEKGQPSKKISLLLVEDNEDFRFYLKDNLNASYNVVEAVDGHEGWKKAIELQPEIIVSDIMMPHMNGLELSKKLKGDPRTSHIPLILLTAMASEEQQLEGFQSGANDYITKPFNFEILLSRINSLLNQRKLMRKAFQKQLEVNPAGITVTPIDEQFIKDALAVVEANIPNAEFSVEDFSRAMHMSRVALYKKLLSITGRPPLEFIRSIRLKRAAQLLQKTNKSVAEVAYEVGFNNPKYFARYFKEEFNVLPSKYAATGADIKTATSENMDT